MSTKRAVLVTGASVLSATALIVVKMLAMDWAGQKLQARLHRD